ncbi:hypothetical protein ACJIZ3_004946 [Penstemon smallii]|uniref:CHY-type domain-containing protein n=1 Tax=Penstemon smallii TaxID=265156 RepID=A0ABD3S3N4_9LAMI
MACLVVNDSGAPHVEPKVSQPLLAEENEIENIIDANEYESHLQPSHEEHIPTYEWSCQEKPTDTNTLDKGYLKYGCSHYRRRCRIRAPCCNEIFDCRHCHNEAKNNICIDQKLRHDVPRHLIVKVGFSRSYAHSVTLNKRFNKFARIVGYAWEGTIVESASCLMMIHLKSSIIVMAVAFAGLGAPRISSTVINVAAIHVWKEQCTKIVLFVLRYACPICSKSVCDMSKVWEKFDQEIAATPMPPYFSNKMVSILCNDCGSNSEVKYHVVAHKCPICDSYNTRQTRGQGG